MIGYVAVLGLNFFLVSGDILIYSPILTLKCLTFTMIGLTAESTLKFLNGTRIFGNLLLEMKVAPQSGLNFKHCFQFTIIKSTFQ